MINEETRKDILPRLRKIEGQIREIHDMVEEERYCIDIVNQITAAQRDLDQVNFKEMKHHIESWVTDAIRADGSAPMVGELMETIHKFTK